MCNGDCPPGKVCKPTIDVGGKKYSDDDLDDGGFGIWYLRWLHQELDRNGTCDCVRDRGGGKKGGKKGGHW